ncbi:MULTISPECIES: UDP-N-acetylmuramate dehydrogenase [Pseudomonas]|uniref:UDP-N-acetylenolpyruvoylglucosamine reductase n=1 Tax=Pseudomonas neustonica TaxID=2487346 RepID=A0ABX9XGS2_9PSED|nr:MULTISPECIES: UDP-N-acetylmuramate dehydrogenase [Pseudomonas]MAB23496.1 UDP-N-acetylenolpyruvoylglucosamine reductase [Pseudomonadales bacterium]MBA6418733.1 UDP-N-acetylmuramate dehydrogenase [Pseudomonas sp. 5Ae-yellow]ROZ81981.1 UDP-N-acetylmuramate dehydrogenase [Pseudomonas sp. SSM44]ROZ83745.1 UDP-N-acetylmuramate dehydrogenase [Pseudomonas neustonica]
MIALESNVDLRAYNTLAVSERAERLLVVEDDRQLQEALALAGEHDWPVTLLGGGSNLVLAGPVAGLVLLMRSRGRRVLSRSSQAVVIEAAAGENWHDFVSWSLDLGLSGLENLSLIPGTVGAAPVQNIGAYGVEVKDVFHSLDALDRQTGEVKYFSLEDSEFSYRDSHFKRSPGRYIILRVRFRLFSRPQINIAYAPLAAAWQATGLRFPDPRVVSELVCTIRRSKLPDPKVLPNAGSFFKNPLVPQAAADALLLRFPGMPHFPQADGLCKLAAGWLIEQAGWKGFRQGDVGVHAAQALVLVNYGMARGADILALAADVAGDVQQRFGVSLEQEPPLLGQP